MDFGSVLYTAHKNEKTANKEVKCYKTKFDPPKKEVKPTKPNLSANIQKYLQKREEEERRKSEEEKRKKEELLALRSQDKKAFKRVQTMLKRTKSANKSVMEDAIDDVNTVVTMAGPQQCDEDDYGYVSKEASELYAKMMDKYANMPPEEPKFSQSKKSVPKDLNAAKDRVRAALQRAEEEEMMPHKRKRKSKHDKNDEDHEEDDEERRKESRDSSPVEEPKPKKPKKMAPPPIDFSSLLKLAEQKQFEPIKIEKKVEDDERPMTKRQKLEYERELESRRRKEEREAMRIAALSKNSRSSDSGDKGEKSNGLGRIPKKSNVSNSKPKQDIIRRDSLISDDDQVNKSNFLINDGPKRKMSSNTVDRPHNNFEQSSDHKKESSILRSSLLKSDERKPLKPTQPSISHNKMKFRNHNVSDDEQSEASESDCEKSHYSRSNFKEHKSEQSRSQKEQNRKNLSGSEKGISERNGYKKYSSIDNECTDSQSSNDSRKFQSSKSQPSSETNYHKYKPQVKIKSDFDKHKSDNYKPSYIEKSPSKKPNARRERSPSPENSSNRYSEKSTYSCSESENEDENQYRPEKMKQDQKPSKKEGFMYKTSYWEKGVQGGERNSQSPDNHNNNKKIRDSYSERESQRPSKSSQNKIKKFSSLFEGSDDENSSSHESAQGYKESETKKPKYSNEPDRHKESNAQRSSTDSPRQKFSSSDSKFKIPKSSRSESESNKILEGNRYKSSKTEYERNKISENDRYKSSGPSKSISSSKLSGQDKPKDNIQNIKSERTSLNSKSGGDRSNVSTEKSDIKQRSSLESSKTNAKETVKKTTSQNAEEVLKKSASVWSKPCNLSTPSSTPRPPGGLSESQLQRLREMNKKPTPSKPPEDRFRTTPPEKRSSLTGRPSQRDERKSDGRPALSKMGPNLQGKQSLLMKAAADRGAIIKAQMANSRSSESTSRPSGSKSLSKPSTSPANRSRDPPTRDDKSKTGEMKPKQFPPSDLKPKQFPPSDIKPRQFPPKDVRTRQFPPPDVKRKTKPRKYIRF